MSASRSWQEVLAPVRGVPEMVVRIDDRQIGVQDRLLGPLREPGLQAGVRAEADAGVGVNTTFGRVAVPSGAVIVFSPG